MAHRVLIKLDNNENGLKHQLGVLPLKENIVYDKLPVGDILYLVDKVPTLLIERKEVGDFRGSVADGRFREQRSRMIELRKEFPHIILAFLFEGSFASLNYNPNSSIQQRTLEDLANDLGPKYGICRLRSNSLMDTLRLIGRYENVYKEKGPTADIVASNNIAESMSIGKKRGIDRESFAPCALSLVPGLTREAAMSVTAVYPTLLGLITAFEGIDDDKTREELLVGFQYGDGLSIGPTVAKRVYHFLLDIDPPPPKPKRKAPSQDANSKKHKADPKLKRKAVSQDTNSKKQKLGDNATESSSSSPSPVRNKDKSPKRSPKLKLQFTKLRPSDAEKVVQKTRRRKRQVIDDD
jgi:ERCC4-type nuclease